MRHRSLPRIVIPIACTADWNAMRLLEADGRARLCGSCDTPVYDSRSMTRGELQRLIVKHEGSLPCLRLHQRPDGTIVTGSCFAPVLRAGRFLWLKATMAAVAFWSTVFCFWSWTRRPTPSVIDSAVSAEKETRKLPFVIKGPTEAEKIRREKKAIKEAGTETATWSMGRPRHVPERRHHRKIVDDPHRKPVDDPLAGLADL
jgi:hypothetical protein